MQRRITTSLKLMVIPVLVVFSLLLLGGLFSHTPSVTSQMSGCMFDSSEECLFGFSEHLVQWQNTFYLSERDTLIYLFVAAAALMLLVATYPRGIERYIACTYMRRLYTRFVRHRKSRAMRRYEYLRVFLSRGILHPKLF